MSFRYPCYRDFKSYAGRVSAVYELIEIAVRKFEDAARQSENEERFITATAETFGLNVHFSRCPNLFAEVVSLHIVNVHEAFERFLASLREEASILLSIQWKDYDKKDSLFVATQNAFGSQKLGRTTLGEMQVDLCEYYRLVRNAAIHSDRDPATLMDKFARVKEYRAEASRQYETITTAPNPPNELTRDDFQLFVRVAQDVAWGFSQKLMPTDEQCCTALRDVMASFTKRWGEESERVKTGGVNYLHKTYGIPKDDAVRIVSQVH